jgi:hypothetical protein
MGGMLGIKAPKAKRRLSGGTSGDPAKAGTQALMNNMIGPTGKKRK